MAWVSRAVLTFKFINGGGQLSPSGFHLGTIMKLQRREFLRLASAATTMPAVSRSADAQSYPTRPITMIVPFPAGGPTDLIARVIGERMRSSLGQSVVIENTLHHRHRPPELESRQRRNLFASVRSPEGPGAASTGNEEPAGSRWQECDHGKKLCRSWYNG